MKGNASSFRIINDDGKEVVCDILFTYDNEKTNNSYIVYTDHSMDEAGNVQVYASIYNPNLEEQVLKPITSDKEWKTIEIILEEIQKELKEHLLDSNDDQDIQDE